MKYLMLGLISLTLVVGCASTPEYGSHGPEEQWHFSHVDSSAEGYERIRKRIDTQRSWGWAIQFALVNDDGSVDELVVGPSAFSQDGRSIEVSYFVISKEPVSGQLRFSASPEYGYALPESWIDGVTHEVEVLNGSVTGSLTLPVVGIPTYGVLATWSRID